MAVKSVRAVANTTAVIEALSASPGSGVSALARDVGIDKMAVQRILVTLREVGWIRQSNGQSGRWELSPRLVAIGRCVAGDLRALARQHLEALQEHTGETVLLWAIDGNRAVVVDAIDSDEVLRMTVPIGTQAPVDGGIAPYLAPDADRDALPEFFTIYDAYPNAAVVGVPIYQGGTTPSAMIMVVGPRSRMNRARLRSIGRELVRVGHVLEATSAA